MRKCYIHSIEFVWFYWIYALGKEYVKVILHDGRMAGAILIGETDLEVWKHQSLTYVIKNGIDMLHNVK